MVNIDSLMNALPISGLEPAYIAFIGGLVDVPKDQRWQYMVHFLEPPAGAREPYIDPVEVIETLLRGEGVATEIAQTSAREAVARMVNTVSVLDWVNFLDDLEPESPECLPVRAFVEWLREEWTRTQRQTLEAALDAQTERAPPRQPKFNGPDVADFFERAAELVACTPMLRGTDNWQSPYSLMDKPALPPAKAMIEFVPGAPWFDFDWSQESESSPREDSDFLLWRESIRPVAEALEQKLGEPVYYFADLSDDLDDDSIHRFLVLHWCCTRKPESRFVDYVVRVSGAHDVDELKAALIHPASYHHAFEMNYAFFGIDPIDCRFEYPSGERKTNGFVFFTPEAQKAAYTLLRQEIGTDVLLVAPPEMLDKVWIDDATANCRSWSAMYQNNHAIEAPVSILAQIDQLHVIADQQRPESGFDLQLCESVEELLWLAIEYDVDARYYTPDRMGLGNPETCLEQRGVPERVTARLVRKREFTQRLKTIRVDCDYGSSGLWDESGRMLRYDDLDLPFALIRRIAAWQKDFDYTLNPPEWMGDDAWWQRHEREQRSIVRELRAVLKGRVKVAPDF